MNEYDDKYVLILFVDKRVAILFFVVIMLAKDDIVLES